MPIGTPYPPRPHKWIDWLARERLSSSAERKAIKDRVWIYSLLHESLGADYAILCSNTRGDYLRNKLASLIRLRTSPNGFFFTVEVF
jgi:hypothetical protein